MGPGAGSGRSTLVAVLLVLGSLELFWRQQGYIAGMSSYEDLWSFHRERLEGADRDSVALLGGSRMQIGFRPEAFREVHPSIDLVQLADAGKSPLAALEDLALDESFAGLVVCSLPEVTTVPGWNQQDALVRFYRESWTPGVKGSLLLKAPLEESLVLLQPRLRGTKLLIALAEGRLPPLNYYRTHFDRSRDMDFSRLRKRTVRGLVRARIDRSLASLPSRPPAPMGDWRALVERLVELSDQLEARGGKLVLVSFPVRGSFRKLVDEYFPRSGYWEALSSAGLETLHFGDMPRQRTLRLPDQSHLDLRSGRRFTRWIARELIARGLLEPDAPGRSAPPA